MQDSKIITAVEHCYFIVKGLDMVGGDVIQLTDMTSQDEAIAAAKKSINYNDNYCVTIVKKLNDRYDVYLKDKFQTNPSSNNSNWFRCQTVFYGKRMDTQNSKKEYEEHKMEYFFLNGLDMAGGDLQILKRNSFEQAVFQVKAMMNYNPNSVGMIQAFHKDKIWRVFLKDIKKTNPSHGIFPNHKRSVSIFLGKQV